MKDKSMTSGYQPKPSSAPQGRPPSGGTAVGKLTVDVDMSQIDEAIEKAKYLNALMDEAEAKAERLRQRSL